VNVLFLGGPEDGNTKDIHDGLMAEAIGRNRPVYTKVRKEPKLLPQPGVDDRPLLETFQQHRYRWVESVRALVYEGIE
jgi:hypothetical protein